MKNLPTKPEFVFIGYQLRRQLASSSNLTLAANVNPLYFPESKALRREYEEMLLSCMLPFFIPNDKVLAWACQIAISDSSSETVPIVLRCALLSDHLGDAYCEYYNEVGDVVRLQFQRGIQMVNLEVNSLAAGFDVIDVSEAGGCDSAIHTYGLVSPNDLNSNALLGNFAEACEVKKKADADLPGHGPFTLWEIAGGGLVTGPL